MLRKSSAPRYLTPYLLISVGIGLCGWFGLSLYELPVYSEADLDGSIEANLAIDLSRMGTHLRPDAERVSILRESIRAELMAEIHRERQEFQQGLLYGFICVTLGLAYLILSKMSKKQ